MSGMTFLLIEDDHFLPITTVLPSNQERGRHLTFTRLGPTGNTYIMSPAVTIVGEFRKAKESVSKSAKRDYLNTYDDSP